MMLNIGGVKGECCQKLKSAKYHFFHERQKLAADRCL